MLILGSVLIVGMIFGEYSLTDNQGFDPSCPIRCNALKNKCNEVCQCDPNYCYCCGTCLNCLGINWTDCAGCFGL